MLNNNATTLNYVVLYIVLLILLPKVGEQRPLKRACVNGTSSNNNYIYSASCPTMMHPFLERTQSFMVHFIQLHTIDSNTVTKYHLLSATQMKK